MSTEILIALLAVLNAPVYFFLGWLIFDTKAGAEKSFEDSFSGLLRRMLVPRIVRVLRGDDDDDAGSLAQTLGFFITCGLVIYGEYYLITKYWLTNL